MGEIGFAAPNLTPDVCPPLCFDDSNATGKLCEDRPRCMFGLRLKSDAIMPNNWMIHKNNVNGSIIKWMYR